MTALQAYVLAKKVALGAVSGIQNITLQDNQIIFQLNDGTQVSMTIPLPEDGVTPHIGDNGNWFIDTTDTGTAATGPAGPQGLQGIQGESAYDVAVTNGFSGTAEQWLNSLQGISVTGLEINEYNHLICALSNGDIIDAGELPRKALFQVNTYANLPENGSSDILYLTLDNSTLYYWNEEYKAITATSDINLATQEDIDNLFQDTVNNISLATEEDVDNLFKGR